MVEISERDRQLAKLLGKHFIARPDTKAVQNAQGEYRPLRGEPFTLGDLVSHMQGRHTYGHYMINEADQCKLFCFDLDLLPHDDPTKKKPGEPHQLRRLPAMRNGRGQYFGWSDGDPREVWGSRKQGAARDFMKVMLQTAAGLLAHRITSLLEIPTLASYSGSKGCHVYGFLGKTSSQLAREAAHIVLNSFKETQDVTGYWELTRGNNFYSYRFPGMTDKGHPAQDDPFLNWEQMSLEVYPKQDSLSGKDLGNLLRLPLGVNRKSPHRDPAFFLSLDGDCQQPSSFKPLDALTALTTMNPWQ